MDMEDWEMLNTEEHGIPNNFTKSEEEESRFNPDNDGGVVNMEYFTCAFPPPSSSLMPSKKINVETEENVQEDHEQSEIKEVRSLALLPDVLAEMGMISELLLMGKVEDDSVNMKIEHPKCIIREFYQSEDSEDFSSEELSFQDEDDYGDGNKNNYYYYSHSSVMLWGSRLIGAAVATLCVLLLSGCQKRKPRLQNQEIEDSQTSINVTATKCTRGASISFQDFKK